MISCTLLSLAELVIGFTLQMKKLDFKTLTDLVTMIQLLLSGVGTQTQDCRPPKPSLNSIAAECLYMPGTLIRSNLTDTLQGMYNYSCLTVDQTEAQRLNSPMGMVAEPGFEPCSKGPIPLCPAAHRDSG